MVSNELLVANRYFSPAGAKKFSKMTNYELHQTVKTMSDSQLLKYADNELVEAGRDVKGQIVWAHTGFPKPVHRYKLVYQVFNLSIEEYYFYVLEFMRQHEGYVDIIKITDLFAASEHSAFFGSAQQRLGLQQDKVSQFLATIGKMVKELFQLVRELRIIDERVGYYEDALDPKSRSRESAEITLKGIWIDMVEQGAKNPASVYGMSRELQFATLPDLFFSIHPATGRDVDELVDKLEFNRKVKEVLKRKLRTYMEWKTSTFKELMNRKVFTLKYLRQHFDIIKMYMNWVKPYLRNIKRLQMADKSESPDLIAAFEGSMIEIEILGKKLAQFRRIDRQTQYNKHVYCVMIPHFSYRTSPQMNYHQEYQKGPIHIGRIDLTLRGYTWTEKQVKKYLTMKDQEDFRLLESVDASVKAAMEALGDELEGYLREAGEQINLYQEPKAEKVIKKPSAAEPFVAMFKGIGELAGALVGVSGAKKKKEKGPSKFEVEMETKIAKGVVKKTMYQTYKEYKKKCGVVHW